MVSTKKCTFLCQLIFNNILYLHFELLSHTSKFLWFTSDSVEFCYRNLASGYGFFYWGLYSHELWQHYFDLQLFYLAFFRSLDVLKHSKLPGKASFDKLMMAVLQYLTCGFVPSGNNLDNLFTSLYTSAGTTQSCRNHRRSDPPSISWCTFKREE